MQGSLWPCYWYNLCLTSLIVVNTITFCPFSLSNTLSSSSSSWPQPKGYINFQEGTVGSPDETYWGQLLEDQILDKDDVQIGYIDMGRAFVSLTATHLSTNTLQCRDEVPLLTLIDFQVSDADGNTICEMTNAGECTGHDGSFIGHFEGIHNTTQHPRLPLCQRETFVNLESIFLFFFLLNRFYIP